MDKLDKLLVALRSRTDQLFNLYLDEVDIEENDEDEALVESYNLTEEFILKDGKKIRVTDSDKLQQIILTEGNKRVLVKRVMAGYVVEASDGNYTASRTLADGVEHFSIGEKERPALSWAFESIKWLVQNAPAIVGE